MKICRKKIGCGFLPQGDNFEIRYFQVIDVAVFKNQDDR